MSTNEQPLIFTFCRLDVLFLFRAEQEIGEMVAYTKACVIWGILLRNFFFFLVA